MLRSILPLGLVLLLWSALIISCSSAVHDRQQEEQILQDVQLYDERSLQIGGKEFTCQDVVEIPMQFEGLKECKNQCRRIPAKKCIGVHIDYKKNLCIASLKEDVTTMSTKYCTKTKFITNTSKMRNFQCGKVGSTVKNETPTLWKCKQQCNRNCKGFSYDMLKEECTLYHLGESPTTTTDEDVTYGRKCDRKQILRKSIICPCFDDEAAQKAISSIISSDNRMKKGSCNEDTVSGTFGLHYGEDGMMIDQTFSVGDTSSGNWCQKNLILKDNLVPEELKKCRDIITESCNKLGEMGINPPKEDEEEEEEEEEDSTIEECGCFTSEVLMAFDQRMKSANYKELPGSCEYTEGSVFFMKYVENEDYPLSVGYAIEQPKEGESTTTCMFDGDVAMEISSAAASTCLAILRDACDQRKI